MFSVESSGANRMFSIRRDNPRHLNIVPARWGCNQGTPVASNRFRKMLVLGVLGIRATVGLERAFNQPAPDVFLNPHVRL